VDGRAGHYERKLETKAGPVTLKVPKLRRLPFGATARSAANSAICGVILKRSWAGEVRNISVLVAIGIGTDGFRQILGVAEGEKEDLEGWRGFLCHLRDRGLTGVRLIISDAEGVVEAAAFERWQYQFMAQLRTGVLVLRKRPSDLTKRYM
jgi:transposase-like protein